MNSFSILSDNLISWWIQVTVIAALGTALPVLFRIRHPKTQIAFYHFILVICVVLPLIEPWHHPLLIANGAVQSGVNLLPGISWPIYLGWIIAAGMLAKLCWLAGGFLQIRRYRALGDSNISNSRIHTAGPRSDRCGCAIWHLTECRWSGYARACGSDHIASRILSFPGP